MSAEHQTAKKNWAAAESDVAADLRRELERDSEARLAFEHRQDVLEAATLIRSMRKASGLSQRQLASALGVAEPRISELERGQGTHGPTYRVLKRVARACGVELRVEWTPRHSAAAPDLSHASAGTHASGARRVKRSST
jgi:ribosome-binding protein aMBF1 (putative translation factor)